jgi:hypothetical protein
MTIERPSVSTALSAPKAAKTNGYDGLDCQIFRCVDWRGCRDLYLAFVAAPTGCNREKGGGRFSRFLSRFAKGAFEIVKFNSVSGSLRRQAADLRPRDFAPFTSKGIIILNRHCSFDIKL